MLELWDIGIWPVYKKLRGTITNNMKSFKLKTSEHISASLIWMFVVAAVIYNTMSLPGYDAYYNVQIAQLMREGNWVLPEFPWTTCSIWTKSYFDKEWLFHIYLVPFIVLFGKIQGAKIATLAAVFFVAFSWGILLKSLGLKRYLFSALFFMLFVSGYLFLGRIVLCRSLLFSLIFLPLAIAAAINRKRLLLSIIVYLYMLTYVGAWQILPIIIIFDAFEVKKGMDSKSILKNMMFPWVIIGLLAGIIFNPYFPVNIKGIFIQTILVLKAKWFGVQGSPIIQAAELTPISSKRILWHLPLFIIFAFTTHSMCKNRSFTEMKRPAGVFFILTCLYLVMTIFSQRFIEYLVPFSTIFIFIYWYEFPFKNIVSNENKQQEESAEKYTISTKKLHIILFILLLINGMVSTAMLHKNFYRDHLFYQDSAEWLKNNEEKNSIVFTGDWDMGAVLFCNAPEFRYLVMLEPYFMYAYSPEKYSLWNKICTGKITQPSVIIVNEFDSNIVFVPHDRPALFRKLQLDKYSELKFEGKTGESIFKLNVPKIELKKAQEIKEWIEKKRQ